MYPLPSAQDTLQFLWEWLPPGSWYLYLPCAPCCSIYSYIYYICTIFIKVSNLVYTVNRNYRHGYNFELRVKKHYESLGSLVITTSGSHSPTDSVAAKKGVLLLIQCKSNGKISLRERDALIAAADKAGAIPFVAWRTRFGRKLMIKDARNF